MNKNAESLVARFHQVLTLLTLLAIPLFVYWRIDLVDAKIGRKFGLPDTFDLAVIHADALMRPPIDVRRAGVPSARADCARSRHRSG